MDHAHEPAVRFNPADAPMSPPRAKTIAEARKIVATITNMIDATPPEPTAPERV